MIKRKVISGFLAICIFVLSISMSFAMDVSDKDTNTKAQVLNKLGMLTGDEKGNYNLSSKLKRGEAATFIIKLMGKNDYVLRNKVKYINTGFSDVKPTDWYAAYVGFCKENSIVSGLGNKKFGPKQDVTEKAYLTMTMKVLGYTSEDFTWGNVYQKAFEIGLVTDESYKNKKDDNKNFTREDVVNAIDKSLGLKIKDTDTSLVTKLVTDGVISQEKAAEAGFKFDKPSDSSPVVTPAASSSGNNNAPGGSTQGGSTPSDTTTPGGITTPVDTTTPGGITTPIDTSTPGDITTPGGSTPGDITTPGVGTPGDTTTTSGGITTPEVSLDVLTVSATNLRELVVTFNKTPNADEARNIQNYIIKSSSTVSANPEQVTVSEDGKTITLRTSSANHMINYSSDTELTISKVFGFSADIVVKGIVARDTTIPNVISAKMTTPRNIKVTLSEPIDEAITPTDIVTSLKIDDGMVAIDISGCTISGLEISIKTYVDLTLGAHKIEFVSMSAIQDNAGYKLKAATITFAYIISAPLAFNLIESTDSTVTIKFNKAIKPNTFTGNKNVKLSHTNADTNTISAETAVTTSDNQTFMIDFGTSNPIPQVPTTVYIKYDSESGTKIEDNYGNKLAATSFIVKLTATAVFVDAMTVRVTYSTDVLSDLGANAANNLSNYVLKSGTEGIQITNIIYPLIGSKRIIDLKTLPDALDGTIYTLNIKNVKDLAANQIDEVTLAFTGVDKVAPVTKKVELLSSNKLRVVFSEAMDVATITNKSIYKIATGNLIFSNLNDDDTIVAVEGNKAVIITLKTAPASGTINTLRVGWVKDVPGNYSTSFSKDFNFIGGDIATTIPLKEYQLTGKNSITLVVDDYLGNMVCSDFEYTTSAGAAYQIPYSLTVRIVNGNTYITLQTKDLSSTTGAGIEVRTTANVQCQNSYGIKLLVDTTVADPKIGFMKMYHIIDKCPPTVVGNPTFTLQDDIQNAAKTLESITITYSENINPSSVSVADYTIAGYDVSNVTVAGTKLTISVNNVDHGSYTPGTEFTVKQVANIEDMNGNILASQAEITFK